MKKHDTQFNGLPFEVFMNKEGEPIFMAGQVTKILGLGNVTNMVRNLEEEEKFTLQIVKCGQRRKHIAISEVGLYKLILATQTEEAKIIRKEVFGNFLPLVVGNTKRLIELKTSDIKKELLKMKEGSIVKGKYNYQTCIVKPLKGFFCTDIPYFKVKGNNVFDLKDIQECLQFTLPYHLLEDKLTKAMIFNIEVRGKEFTFTNEEGFYNIVNSVRDPIMMEIKSNLIEVLHNFDYLEIKGEIYKEVEYKKVSYKKGKSCYDYLYLIQNIEDNILKIGRSFNVEERLKMLEKEAKKELKILYKIKGYGPEELNVHNKFKKFRITGEWFENREEIIKYFSQTEVRY